jgi:hypothetical protein
MPITGTVTAAITSATITAMAKALLRSPPRKRGPRKADSRRRGNEQKTSAGTALQSAALYRLMAWLSPAYPVGAFSYSSGIEWAVEAGDIGSAETLRAWLATMIRQGSVFCDAALFAHAHRAVTSGDDNALAAVAELAAALAGSKERFLETTAQGQALLSRFHAKTGSLGARSGSAATRGPRPPGRRSLAIDRRDHRNRDRQARGSPEAHGGSEAVPRARCNAGYRQARSTCA